MFADDTAVVGLITHGDEREVEDLMWWCGDRSLILSPQNPKDTIMHFKSLPPPTPPPSKTAGGAHQHHCLEAPLLTAEAEEGMAARRRARYILQLYSWCPSSLWGMEAAHWQRRRLCGGGRRVAMQPSSGRLCVGKRSRETRLKFGSLSLVDLRCTRTTVSLPTPERYTVLLQLTQPWSGCTRGAILPINHFSTINII